MSVRHCVGAVIVTDLPTIGLAAIMHRRGVYDPEHIDWETWPHDFQVTAFGCVQDQADICWINALIREVTEELGPAVGQLFDNHRADIKLLSEIKSEKQHTMIYGLKLPDPSWIQQARLHPASGGLYPIHRTLCPPNAHFFSGHHEAALRALDVL